MIDSAQGLVDLVSAVFAGLAAAFSDEDNTTPLNVAIDRLRACSATVESLPVQRPWCQMLNIAKDAVAAFIEAIRCYLLAMCEDTPLAAQQLAQRGQQHLDQAAEHAHTLRRLGEVFNAQPVSSTPADYLTHLLAVAYESAGTRDPLRLEQAGAVLAQTLLTDHGPPVAVLPGQGIQILLHSVLADLVFDADQFRSTARSLHRVFRAHPQRLRKLVEDPLLRADLAEAADHLLTGSMLAAVVFASALPDQVHLSAVLDMARTVVEGPGKRLLAAFLAVTAKLPYEQRRTKDASALHSAALAQPAGAVWTGLDLPLRHAAAHLDFRVDDSTVLLAPTGRRPDRVSVTQLLDRLLAGMETICAALLALYAAAAELDNDLTDPRGLAVLGLSQEESIVFALGVWGWNHTTIAFTATPDGTRLDIDTHVDATTRLFTALATVLPQHVPDDVTHIKVNLRETEPINRAHEDQIHRLHGPMYPWRDRHKPEADKPLTLVETQALWQFDDQPLMPRELVRRYVARRAGNALTSDPPAAIADVRSLRQFAHRIGDTDLAAALTNLLTHIRCQAQGLAPTDPQLKTGLTHLYQWGITNPPPTGRLAGANTLQELRR